MFVLGVAPCPVIASDHQDDITCLGSGIPINLHFPLLLGRGTTQCLYIYIYRKTDLSAPHIRIKRQLDTFPRESGGGEISESQFLDVEDSTPNKRKTL